MATARGFGERFYNNLLRPLLILSSIFVAYLLLNDMIENKQQVSLPNDSLDGGTLKSVMKQRNELSALLNNMSRAAARLSCQILKLRKKYRGQTDVSLTGGWCESNLTPEVYNARADPDLVLALSTFLKGKTVGSFGDGPGTYKMLFDRDNKVKSYHAYDGGPYYDRTSHGTVFYMDLRAPQYGLPLFDWVISLEVAEHIDRKYEATYLSNIVRHAREGVVISWAVPGQPGIQHINCKPFSYVVRVMDKLGFDFSSFETQNIRRQTKNIWYSKNVSIFRRRSNSTIDETML